MPDNPPEENCKEPEKVEEPPVETDPTKVTVNLVATDIIASPATVERIAELGKGPGVNIDRKVLEKVSEMELLDLPLPPSTIFDMLLAKNDGDTGLLSRKLMEWFYGLRQDARALHAKMFEVLKTKEVVMPLNRGQVVIVKSKNASEIKKAVSKAMARHDRHAQPIYILLTDDDKAYLVDNAAQIRVKKDRSKGDEPDEPDEVIPEPTPGELSPPPVESA